MSDVGNIDRVRSALGEITGVEVKTATPVASDNYFVITRMGREHEAVDCLRRNRIDAEWPSYELLQATRERGTNRLVRRMRRVGVLPGYVFAKPAPDIDFEAVLRRVVGAIDVARKDSGLPIIIHDRDLDAIRKIAIGLNAPRPEKLEHDFKRGEKVWFVEDIVSHWPAGTVEKLAQDGRIGVEVPVMGRKVLIWALPHQIERRKHRPARDAGSQPKALDGERTRDTRLK